MFSYPKNARLLRSSDFAWVRRRRTHLDGRHLLIELRRSSSSPGPRLGLTVTKKMGKAVSRNHFKRLIREMFRLHRHELDPSIHLQVRPKKSAMTASFRDLEADFLGLVKPPASD